MPPIRERSGKRSKARQCNAKYSKAKPGKNITKISPQTIKNHEKTVLGAPWGPSGTPRGCVWEPSGPQETKKHKKVSYFPPVRGPKLEPKITPRAFQELTKTSFFVEVVFEEHFYRFWVPLGPPWTQKIKQNHRRGVQKRGSED